MIYNLENGLKYNQWTYSNTNNYDYKTGTIQPDEILTTSDLSETTKNRVTKAIDNATQEGCIGYIKIEPDKNYEEYRDNGEVILFFFAWGGYSNNYIAYYELCALAQQNPTKTIIAIDSLGASKGQSTELPLSYGEKMIETGSFDPYAEYIMPAIETLTNGYKKFDLLGPSTGARIATSIAGNKHFNSSHLNIFEPVGDHDMSPLKLAYKFVISEGYHLRKYFKYSEDTTAKRAQKECPIFNPDILLERRIGQKALGLTNQFYHLLGTMAKDGFEKDLLKTLKNVNSATISIANSSEITNIDSLHHILYNIYKNDNAEIDNETILRLYYGISHAVPTANPGAYSAILTESKCNS